MGMWSWLGRSRRREVTNKIMCLLPALTNLLRRSDSSFHRPGHGELATC